MREQIVTATVDFSGSIKRLPDGDERARSPYTRRIYYDRTTPARWRAKPTASHRNNGLGKKVRRKKLRAQEKSFECSCGKFFRAKGGLADHQKDRDHPSLAIKNEFLSMSAEARRDIWADVTRDMPAAAAAKLAAEYGLPPEY